MMFKAVLDFLFLCNLLQIIENRLCPGIDGVDCCIGFTLNKVTGKCESMGCAIGYQGNDCTKKCVYPTYGEDCQSICQCSEDDCHFSSGCVLKTDIVTEAEQLSSTKLYSSELTNTFSNLTRSNVTFAFIPSTYAFFTVSDKQIDTTVKNSQTNTDLLKNNIVISLLGIFVLFFSLFVISYIYLKCFRKKETASGMKNSEQHSQYNSLNFNQVEPESTVDLEPLRRMEADSAYLLPVSSPNEGSELKIKHESNKIIQDTSIHGYEITKSQELNIIVDNVHDHVYIEIAEDNI